MRLKGYKKNIDLYKNLIQPLLPNKFIIYVEPFGGHFGLYQLLENKPFISIYNDTNTNFYKEIEDKFDHVRCYNMDYKEIIQKYDSVGTFFYCDPPYFEHEKYYQNHEFKKWENHLELFSILDNIKGNFLLSYNNKPEILELYNKYNIFHYKGNSVYHKGEICITNY